MECRNIILTRIKLFGLDQGSEAAKPRTLVVPEATASSGAAFVS